MVERVSIESSCFFLQKFCSSNNNRKLGQILSNGGKSLNVVGKPMLFVSFLLVNFCGRHHFWKIVGIMSVSIGCEKGGCMYSNFIEIWKKYPQVSEYQTQKLNISFEFNM